MSKQYYAVQRTDEKKNKLIHADRKKHKYIYKKMVNGKMRYYYDVGPAGFDLANNGRGPGKDGEPDSNIQGYTKLEDMLGKDEKDKYWRSVSAAHNEKRFHDHNYGKLHDKYGGYEMGNAEHDKSHEDISRAQRKVMENRKEYMKTPLGKITRLTEKINDGRDAVANMLDKLSKDLRSYDTWYY